MLEIRRFMASRLVKKLQRRQVLPVVITLLGLLSTGLVWRLVVTREQEQLRRELTLQAEKARSEVASALQTRVLALLRQARRWEVTGRPDSVSWEFDAQLLMRHFPGFHSIHWVDAGGRIRWSAVQKDYTGRPLRKWLEEPSTQNTLQLSHSLRQVRLSRPLKLEDANAFLASLPIFHKGRMDGVLVGLFGYDGVLDAIFQERAVGRFRCFITEKKSTAPTTTTPCREAAHSKSLLKCTAPVGRFVCDRPFLRYPSAGLTCRPS
jgi:sensor domain CHASE-containing protein